MNISKSKKFGRVEGFSEGICDFKIAYPEKLVSYLLLENAYIKDEKAKLEIARIIGNKVNYKLETSKLPIEELLTNPNAVYQILNENNSLDYEFAGLQVSDIKMESLKTKTKMHKKISSEIQKQRDFLKTVDLGNGAEKTMPMPNVNLAQELLKSANEKVVEIDTQKYTKKNCKFCGKDISATAVYCEHCGFNQNSI